MTYKYTWSAPRFSGAYIDHLYVRFLTLLSVLPCALRSAQGVLRGGDTLAPMTIIDMVELDHDQITEKVRMELARRLTGLLDRFEVFLEDDPREFSPGQIANYLNAVKLLGSLYQAHQRPVDKSGMIPADRVEKLIEAACAQAVAEALEAERLAVASRTRLALESAGTGIRDALAVERARQARTAGN